MRVIALCQAYNEALFIERALTWIYPLVDRIVITEGCLTPFGNQSPHSTDGTAQIIADFIQKNDKEGKIIACPVYRPEVPPATREAFEGLNKNYMLKLAEPEHGDLIFILDCDEFWEPNRFANIVDKFRTFICIRHIPVEEYQFAYNLRLAFEAEHNGRFMRFVRGSRFGDTNHFIYPDGRDVTKEYDLLRPRAETQMAHLCWCKHPLLIREKVVSFNRPSFTNWFNYVYLVWPTQSEKAYRNNSNIAPYHGTGFAEGQHSQLLPFTGQLPPAIADLNIDWLPFIEDHATELSI